MERKQGGKQAMSRCPKPSTFMRRKFCSKRDYCDMTDLGGDKCPFYDYCWKSNSTNNRGEKP